MPRLRQTPPSPLQPLALTILLALTALLPGCLFAAATGAAGAIGLVSYHENEVYRDFQLDLPTCWKAAVYALEHQGYELDEEPKLRPTDNEVRAGEAWVRVERHAEGYIRIRVRVGTFASQENLRLSKLLLGDIARRLGEPTF